ncbi:hypothetical protein MKX03_015028 [Papaver bracteatum]|nr:hypothetical protein MKX03_015028 [Papaver bracteatum]
MAVAGKVFESLFGDASNSAHFYAQIATMVAIGDVCKLVVEELTNWVVYSDDEYKFSKDIIFHNLIEALAKPATRPGSLNLHRSLLRFPEMSLLKPLLRQVIWGNGYNVVESMTEDPLVFHDQVLMLYNEWHRICEATGTDDSAQSGLLKGDDMTDLFFRLLMELSVTHCLPTDGSTPGSLSLQLPQQVSALSFVAIDMYPNLCF